MAELGPERIAKLQRSAPFALLATVLLLGSCTRTELRYRPSEAPADYVGDLWCFNSNVPDFFNVAFSPDGKYLAVAGDYSVRVLDVETGQPVSCFGGIGEFFWHTYAFWNVVEFPPMLLFGWEHYDERKPPRNPCVCAVAFTPDSRDVLTADRDGTIRLWNARTGSQKRVVAQLGWCGGGVVFAPDGKYAIRYANSRDGDSTQLWDLEARKMRWQVPIARHVCFARDGRHVLTYGAHWCPDVRETLTGDPVDYSLVRAEFRNAEFYPPVHSALSADGFLRASCDPHDGSVRLRRIRTQDCEGE